MKKDTAASVIGDRPKTGRSRRPGPALGARCANCGAPLHGPFCHDCGQDFDAHKRSILQLAREATEGLLDLDGRLMRTMPDLFLRPGRLARDYLDGRIARHLPPFRLFLASLVLFIFAAEHAIHTVTEEGRRRDAAHAAALATPQGRAAEAARIRREAQAELTNDLREADRDRAEDLADPDEDHAKVERRHATAVAEASGHFAADMNKADRIAAGATDSPGDGAAGLANGYSKTGSWWRAGLRKAIANPDYYVSVLMTWGHRAAFLLLPIIGLSLAAACRKRRRYLLSEHLTVAMLFLAFVFLTNAVGLVLPAPLMGWWLGVAAIWTPINLFQILRGAYGSSLIGAALKASIIWIATIIAFTTILFGLLVFSLAQL